MKTNILVGTRVLTVKGNQRTVVEVLEGGYLLDSGKRVKAESIAQVLPPPPLDPEVIDYAVFCLSCPEITEAEGIDAVLNFRQALTPAEMAELIQAFPPKLAKKLYALQETFDRHLIPVGATVYGQHGTGALVVARDKDGLTIQADGKQGDTSPSNVLRWKYPVSDRTIEANEQN
jgi:hypothetical protein